MVHLYFRLAIVVNTRNKHPAHLNNRTKSLTPRKSKRKRGVYKNLFDMERWGFYCWYMWGFLTVKKVVATPRGGMCVRVFLFCSNPTPIQVWFSHIFALTRVSSFQEMSSKAITIFFLLSAKLSLRNLKALTQDLIHEKQYSSKYCALNGAGNTQAAVTPKGA